MGKQLTLFLSLKLMPYVGCMSPSIVVGRLRGSSGRRDWPLLQLVARTCFVWMLLAAGWCPEAGGCGTPRNSRARADPLVDRTGFWNGSQGWIPVSSLGLLVGEASS